MLSTASTLDPLATPFFKWQSMSQVFNTWLSKCTSPCYNTIRSGILKMPMCIVTTDQYMYVFHINGYSTQVSGELLHNLLEVSRCQIEYKRQSHL